MNTVVMLVPFPQDPSGNTLACTEGGCYSIAFWHLYIDAADSGFWCASHAVDRMRDILDPAELVSGAGDGIAWNNLAEP